MNNEIIKSSLLGFVVGDALGVPFEFFTREKMKLNPATKMTCGGSWEQPIGTWSDDTSMVLATLDCLSIKYDLSLLGSNFQQWLFLNEYTPHGKVFDCGTQTKKGINRINELIENNRRVTPFPPVNDETKNGNGSLMRILPFGFYLHNRPIKKRFEIIKDVSALTHPHIRSAIGCFIYSELVMELMKGEGKDIAYKTLKKRVSEFLGNIVPSVEMDHFKKVLQGDISILKVEEIKSTTYVVSTLEAVIWSFLRSDNYKESILTAVNLGGDTDTIAALVGGLAGIIYRMERMPPEWVDKIVKKDEISRLIESFIKGIEK